MKDVAYFLGSAMDVAQLLEKGERLLSEYLEMLGEAVERRQPEVDAQELVGEWRRLFPVAWADVERFLRGWAPDHWKLNDYSAAMTEKALEQR